MGLGKLPVPRKKRPAALKGVPAADKSSVRNGVAALNEEREDGGDGADDNIRKASGFWLSSGCFNARTCGTILRFLRPALTGGGGSWIYLAINRWVKYS